MPPPLSHRPDYFLPKGPDALTHIEAQLRYSLRSIADAAANHDVLTEPVDPVLNDGSTTAVVPLTEVALVPIGADVDAARTDRKLHSVCRGYRSHGQCDQRGEREDHPLHLAPPLRIGGALGQRSGRRLVSRNATQKIVLPI